MEDSRRYTLTRDAAWPSIKYLLESLGVDTDSLCLRIIRDLKQKHLEVLEQKEVSETDKEQSGAIIELCIYLIEYFTVGPGAARPGSSNVTLFRSIIAKNYEKQKKELQVETNRIVGQLNEAKAEDAQVRTIEKSAKKYDTQAVESSDDSIAGGAHVVDLEQQETSGEDDTGGEADGMDVEEPAMEEKCKGNNFAVHWLANSVRQKEVWNDDKILYGNGDGLDFLSSELMAKKQYNGLFLCNVNQCLECKGKGKRSVKKSLGSFEDHLSPFILYACRVCHETWKSFAEFKEIHPEVDWLLYKM